MASKELLDELARQLVDAGKLIEAGWVSLRMTVLPPDASETQLDETRFAFFAGAQHLFASIMSFLDSDMEPTERDLLRMSKLQTELDEFLEEMKRKIQ